MKTTNTVQCVLVWVEEDRVWDGQPYAADLGERPGFRTVQKARAAMWLHEASPADVERAKAYAAREGAQVLTFRAEKDPLGAAKRRALKKLAA